MNRTELDDRHSSRPTCARRSRWPTPEVDFSPYSLVYVMPPRNATGIEFSPELNFYQEPLRPDGKVIRNGVTYGKDIFIWGHRIINHETGHDISFPESYNGGPGDDAPVGRRLGRDGRHRSATRRTTWPGTSGRSAGSTTTTSAAWPPTARPTITLSADGAPSDGGATKKAVVVRTGPHDRDHRRAARAGRRRRHRDDHARARTGMCDWGVLLYKLDVLKLNSYGSIQVHRPDARLDRGGLHA